MGEIIGFFGGKFLPMHKGHLYCIDTAARQCDHVVVIMFINGDEELRVLGNNHDELLSVSFRAEQIQRVCSLYDNVEFHVIDTMDLKKPDGTEDWDAETPLVRSVLARASEEAPLPAARKMPGAGRDAFRFLREVRQKIGAISRRISRNRLQPRL